ncbi:ATP-binding cassette domain-containing protein [Microbispora triticiradicis]|uniref:ATP-binding cassette domain-containing protein n=1 Tax=Microbispora triticiradicis TaxID=2200763 RepID=UPI001AD7030F|nr:ATP-binding cassette domain-containing protein [Microbispora triticiradicis]MBO4272264.1 ATP-binding cassette domain-containing protein [Microbispora triticiradicis]
MIIEAHDLRKTFHAKRGRGKKEAVEAVRGIDLQVERGEVFAVLGPNGAGKTTTVRMLATFTLPTSGSARVAGFDVAREAAKVRENIGYVSQAGGVDDTAPGIESLLLAARISGMSRRQAQARADELLAAFSLTEIANRPAKTLSGGQKRRFAIAVGLVNAPPLIFLDEPTTGLDPQNRANLWDEVRKLREQGTSVLLTTHYLDEADALCDRLVIVDHGRIVARGTPEELKKEVAGDVVTLRLEDTDAARKLLDAQPYVKEVRSEPGVVRAYLDDGEHGLMHMLRTLEENGMGIRSVSLERATLDDVFLKHTGRSLRDAA